MIHKTRLYTPSDAIASGGPVCHGGGDIHIARRVSRPVPEVLAQLKCLWH